MDEQMTIGELLQRARLAKGLNYRDVEQQVNIRSIYLEALEAEDFSCLPSEVYLKGMLRCYGNFLGLDGSELVKQYNAGRKSDLQGNIDAHTNDLLAANHSITLGVRYAEEPSGIPARIYHILFAVLVFIAVCFMLYIKLDVQVPSVKL